MCLGKFVKINISWKIDLKKKTTRVYDKNDVTRYYLLSAFSKIQFTKYSFHRSAIFSGEYRIVRQKKKISKRSQPRPAAVPFTARSAT